MKLRMPKIGLMREKISFLNINSIIVDPKAIGGVEQFIVELVTDLGLKACS